MANFEVIPAIDLRGGRCVRLYQGDYARETVYSENPVEMAVRWASLGAPRLHVVDLDGAASGKPENLPVVREIARAIRIPVELGGGIRTRHTVQTILAAGVRSVILGTVAVEQEELVRNLCVTFGEAIIVGLDARGGKVATRGWLAGTGADALEMARQMVGLGVKRLIYTDIARDGTLTEPNFDAVKAMVKAVKVPVVASGGVATAEHIARLRKLGAAGVIVGKALYSGDLRLEDALAAAVADA